MRFGKKKRDNADGRESNSDVDIEVMSSDSGLAVILQRIIVPL